MESRQPSTPRGRLADPHFRAAMLARLESLIAVLKLARRRAAEAEATHPEQRKRLQRVQANLSQTLEICDTAWTGLQQREDRRAARLAEAETAEEFERLCALGPMPEADLADDELERLCEQLAQLEV